MATARGPIDVTVDTFEGRGSANQEPGLYTHIYIYIYIYTYIYIERERERDCSGSLLGMI